MSVEFALVKISTFERMKLLLEVTQRMLKELDNMHYVENALSHTLVYDGAECDGFCLMEDIGYLLDEITDEQLLSDVKEQP